LRDRAPPAVGAYRQRIARREALARRASRPGGARAERARPGARRQGLEHSAGPRWLQQSDRRIPERWQTPAFPQAAVCTQQARKGRGGPATSLTRGQLQESTGIDVEHARSAPALFAGLSCCFLAPLPVPENRVSHTTPRSRGVFRSIPRGESH
jgi:hypothetical protein